MDVIRSLLIGMLSLSCLTTFNCAGKTPLPYSELIQKKPKI